MSAKQITVLSLGPGEPEWMTLQAWRTLQAAPAAVLRTAQHPAAEMLRDAGIAFDTLDAFYDRYEDFDEMHRAMAAELWQRAAKGPLVYAVIDAAADGSVTALSDSRPKSAKLTILPGVPLSSAVLAKAGLSLPEGCRIVPASSLQGRPLTPSLPLLVTELDNALVCGEVKLALTDLYDDETEVCFVYGIGESGQLRQKRIPLCELDRQKHYDHRTAVLLPAQPFAKRKRYDLDDLVEIMEILRGEDGCPWDREQTHQTLRRYLLEEACEACGAIDEGDDGHLADELGDVLLQIVFHASIGRSHGSFTLRDVTSAICEKMIRRHAHIFGDTVCRTAEEVSENWEKLKKAEKHLSSVGDAMQDVSRALPALMRAEKVQKKAAQVGFDWDSAREALPKVGEEAGEVLAELDAGRDPQEELGDLLFSCVNVARLAGVDPELALTRAVEKFIRRFAAMEKLIVTDEKSLKDLTLQEMDVYWNQVKTLQKRT